MKRFLFTASLVLLVSTPAIQAADFPKKTTFLMTQEQDLKLKCVPGIELVRIETDTPSRGFNTTPDAIIETLKHPFMTAIIYPRRRIEFHVTDKIVKVAEGAKCEPLEENTLVYTVEHGEEYKGMGKAFNATVRDDDDKVTSRFTLVVTEDGAAYSAHMSGNGPFAFLKPLPK